jgi:hypothetical protein
MTDHVVDTNVLLVASAVDPYSPFADSHVPLAEQRTVFEWLAAFRADGDRRLVLDDCLKIYEEYRHQLSEQDYGLQVIHEKMQQFRPVQLAWEDDETAVVPEAFSAFDRSDRKLLAAALTDPATISIVNAADSDWLEIEAELQAAGVTVVHVIEAWLRARKRPDRD